MFTQKTIGFIIVALLYEFSLQNSLYAKEVDILNRVELHSRSKDKCRFHESDAGRILEVDEGAQAILSFEHDTDIPPAGSVIQFFATIRVESETGKEITIRYGCQLEDGERISTNNKYKVTRKPQTFKYGLQWNTSKEEIRGNPSFNISFWKPGRYTISSLSYDYYSFGEGETTIPPLKGSISLDDPNIHIRGAKYVRQFPDHIEVDRFRSSYFQRNDLAFSPDKAHTTTGAMLAFRTTSPTVDLSWGIEPQFSGRKADFAVLLDEKLSTTYSFRLPDSKKTAQFTIDTGATKKNPVTCKVTYPTFSTPYLVGLRLAPGGTLLPLPPSHQGIYVALGDSITHGTGQKGATDKTWAWQFSQQADLELFNLAVGGGKVSVPAGQMLADWKQIDLITILIGFNDCMGAGHTVEEYRNNYDKLLDVIRKNHPQTKIVCISSTWAPNTTSQKSGLSLDLFREEVAEMVTARKQAGDKNIFLARGENLTSEKNKGVHFSIEGAAMFARDLYKELTRQGIFETVEKR